MSCRLTERRRWQQNLQERKEKWIWCHSGSSWKGSTSGGVLAAHTTLPVIGIPVKSSTLDGLDALLATVQMPKGIPVATVAIDGAANAAILAAQMLALSDPEIDAKLEQMKADMEQGVKEKTQRFRQNIIPDAAD